MTESLRPDQVLAASGSFAPKFSQILRTLEESCCAISSDPALQVLRRSPASHHRVPDRVLEIIAQHLNNTSTSTTTTGTTVSAGWNGSTTSAQPIAQRHCTRPLAAHGGAAPGFLTTNLATPNARAKQSSAFAGISTGAAASTAAYTAQVSATAVGLVPPPLTDLEKAESSLGLSDDGDGDDFMSLSQLQTQPLPLLVDFDDSVSIASLTEEKSLLQQELAKASQLLSKMTRERQSLGEKYVAVSEEIEKSMVAQDRERAMSEQLKSVQTQLLTVSSELQKRDETYQRQVEAYRSTQVKHAKLVNLLKEKCLTYKSRSTQLHSLVKERTADREQLRKRLETSQYQLEAFSEQSTELTIALKTLQDQEVRNRQVEEKCRRLEQDVETRSHESVKASASHGTLLEENCRLQQQVQRLQACEFENDQLKSCVRKLSAAVQATQNDLHQMKASVCRDLSQAGDMITSQLNSLKSTTSTSQKLAALHLNAVAGRRDQLAKENRNLEARISEQASHNTALSARLHDAEQLNTRLSLELQETHEVVQRLQEHLPSIAARSQRQASPTGQTGGRHRLADGSTVFQAILDVLASVNVELQTSAAVRQALKTSNDRCQSLEGSMKQTAAESSTVEARLRLEQEKHTVEVSRLDRELLEMRDQNAQLQDGNQQQTQGLLQIQRQLKCRTDDLKEKERELDEAAHAIGDLKSKLSSVGSQLHELDATNKKLVADMETVRGDAGALRSVLDQKQQQSLYQNERHDETVKELQEQMTALHADVRRLQAENAELHAGTTSVDSLKQLSETRLEEINLLQTTISRLRSQREELTSKNSLLTQDDKKCQALQERCSDLERQALDLVSQEKNLTQSLALQTDENQGHLSTIQRLTAENRRLSERIASLQVQLQAVDKTSMAVTTATTTSAAGRVTTAPFRQSLYQRQESTGSAVSSEDEVGTGEQRSMAVISNLEEHLQQLSDQNEVLQAESAAAQTELVTRINELVASGEEIGRLKLLLKEMESNMEEAQRRHQLDLKQQQQEHSLLDQEVSSLRAANAHLASQVSKASDEFNSALMKREAEVKLLNNSLAEATSRLDQMEEEMEDRVSTNNSLVEDRALLVSSLRQFEAGLQRIMSDGSTQLHIPSEAESGGGMPVDAAVDRLVKHVESQAAAVERLSTQLSATEYSQQQLRLEATRRRDAERELAAEITHLRSEVDKKNRSIRDLTGFYDRHEATSAHISQEVGNLRSELSGTKQKLSSIQAVKESLEQALSTSEQQLKEVNARKLELQVQVSGLSSELKQYQTEVTRLRNSQESDARDNANAIETVQNEKDSTLAEVTRQLQLKTEELLTVRLDCGDQKTARDEAETRRSEAEAQLARAHHALEQMSESHRRELHAALSQRQEADLENVDSARHVAALTNQIFDLRAQLQTSEDALANMRQEFSHVHERHNNLKEKHKELRVHLDSIEVQLNSKTEQCNEVEAKLRKTDSDKDGLSLAIEELMGRERSLAARLKAADSKEHTLDMLREQVAEYVQERHLSANTTSAGAGSNRDHLHRNVTDRRRDGGRPDRKKSPHNTSLIESSSDLLAGSGLSDGPEQWASQAFTDGHGEASASRRRHGARTSSDSDTVSDYPGSSAELKLSRTELKAAELQARVFQLENDNQTLTAKVASQRQKMRQTADGLSRNTGETRQIHLALRQSLQQVTSSDMDSRGSIVSPSDLLVSESDDLNRTASALSLPRSRRPAYSSLRNAPANSAGNVSTLRASNRSGGFMPRSASTPRTASSDLLLRSAANQRRGHSPV
eukprot:scpid11097/ scgid15715/ 